MKTGNTTTDIYPYPPEEEASMEPGHEDREYRANTHTNQKHQNASMEPGHEDREYSPSGAWCEPTRKGLNGARS